MGYRCGICILVVLALVGCKHYITPPDDMDEIELETVGKYKEPLSVHLINGQKDVYFHYIDAGMHDYYLNYGEWTKYYIDQLTKELLKRGVVVSEKSPNKLTVKLSHFNQYRGFYTGGTKVEVHLASDGWNKSYEEKDGGYENNVHDSIQKLLADPEFIARMRGGGGR
ncbi:MAG: hypothetical protein ACYTDY_04955 [Planctomycetota bacterium]